MPKVIIVNIPVVYHCILQVQSMLLMPAVSTVLILCITMLITKAFNFDCAFITYMITSVIIRVISVAGNISMSTRKLFKNDLNFQFSSGVSISCPFLFILFLCLQYWTANSHKVFGVLSRLELISKFSNRKGKICSWAVQFHEIGMPNSSFMSSNSSQKPNLL